MKIVFFPHPSQDLYGANRSLLDIVIGLKSKGHDVRVFCSSAEGALVSGLLQNNIKFYFFPYKNSSYRIIDLLFFWRFVRLFIPSFSSSKLKQLLGDWTPEIIYTNNTSVNIGIKLANFLKIPHVWHIREYGWDDYGMLYLPNKKTFFKYLNQSRLVLFISRSLYSFYEKSLTAQFAILQNPIATSPQKICKKTPSINHYTYLVPGLISRKKGQFVALRAFKIINRKFTNTKMILVGGGSKIYMTFLKFYCFLFHIRNVQFSGYSSNMEPYYLQSDCVLVCSKKEALGRVTLEAMMYCVPIIGRDTGGTQELIGSDRGLTFNGTPADLVEKMQLFLLNRGLQQSCSDNALEFINSSAIKAEYMDRLEKLLLSLL